MTILTEKVATYADIPALPPHLVGEVLFGMLVTRPRPVPRHGGASSVLGMLTGNAYQLGVGGPGGWFFIDEPQLHLGPHIAVPDIAGWRQERLPPSAVEKAYIEVAPDWVCEVISPSTEKHDKGDKREIYATFGVEYLWMLDPRVKLLETFKRTERTWTLTGTLYDKADVCVPPFTELTFPLGLLWPFDAPTADPTT